MSVTTDQFKKEAAKRKRGRKRGSASYPETFPDTFPFDHSILSRYHQ